MRDSGSHDVRPSDLTLAEKADFCSGADFWSLPELPRLGIASIVLTDGPHGVRKQQSKGDHVDLEASEPATCFPTASALASTWNTELIERVGEALGLEARHLGVSVLLGPGMNIKRNPRGGRNFEYFSEDPYLTGELATAWVRGVQRCGVGASLKHFAANNHEYGRMVVDAVIDERTLREIYLAAFEATIRRAAPRTVMAAYNKVNGTYASEHRELLTTILREEWGFDGLVVSDWGAVDDRVAGIRAGMDLEMPSSGDLNTQRIIAAVENGSLEIADLDRSVGRVLDLIAQSPSDSPECPCSFDDHHALARTAAEEACVLLKNDSALLPLESCRSVAVLGALATQPRYQGSGSSLIQPTRLEKPLDCLVEAAGSGCQIRYAEGYPLAGELRPESVEEALRVASECDVVVLIAGLTPEYESEGFDRDHLSLPRAQLELIDALAPVHSKLVVVLQNGAPIELPFAGRVPAILEAYLGGQAGGSAVANVLFGRVNPSGRLAESFPIALDDVPSQPWFPGALRQSQYREGIWVGYRYFDSAKVPVAFPFGHGLSYTRFEYSDLSVSAATTTPFRLRDEGAVELEFTLRNVGDRPGAEVAQVYVGQANPSVPRPGRELKRFAKVALDPGESKRVRLELDRRAFAFWSRERRDWVVESDGFEIAVGASVSDIRLRTSISIEGDQPIGPRDPSLGPYFGPRDRAFDDDAFEALLGHRIPAAVPTRPFQRNSTLLEVQESRIGRRLRGAVLSEASKSLGEGSEVQRRLATAIVDQMPLRMVVMQSGGRLSPRLIAAIIHVMNGDWTRLLRGADADSR